MRKPLLTLLLSACLLSGANAENKKQKVNLFDKEQEMTVGDANAYAPEGKEEADEPLAEEIIRVNFAVYDFQEELKQHKLKLSTNLRDIKINETGLEGCTFKPDLIDEDLQAFYTKIRYDLNIPEFGLSRTYSSASNEEAVRRTPIDIMAKFCDRANITFGIQKLEADYSSENQSN